MTSTPASLAPGDMVQTPLGRIARITKVRRDGYLDAEYVGVGLSPWASDTILQPAGLVKLDKNGNRATT